MIYLKPFEEFVREGIAKKSRINQSRADNLILESERKRRNLKKSLEKIKVEDENANDYVEDCYDILMNLVRAKLFLNGYSTGGLGAHEAEVSYLRVMGFSEEDVQFVNQMRYFRNGILYYGTRLDKEYAEKALKFTERTYFKLREILE